MAFAFFKLADRIARAFARALISLRLWAGESLRLPGVAASSLDGIGISPPPSTVIDSISRWSVSIFSLMAIMSLSWFVVKSLRLVMSNGLREGRLRVNHGDGRQGLARLWLLLLHMPGHQLGHFKHADLLLAVEHGLQILVGIDQGLLFGVL